MSVMFLFKNSSKDGALHKSKPAGFANRFFRAMKSKIQMGVDINNEKPSSCSGVTTCIGSYERIKQDPSLSLLKESLRKDARRDLRLPVEEV